MARASGAPRRGWGQGSIRWKNGAFEITVRPYRGARQDPWLRLPGLSRKEAEVELDVIVANLRAGKHESPRQAPSMSLAQLYERYHAELCVELAGDGIEQARVDDIRSMMRAHILPAMGGDPLDQISSGLLARYVAAKRAGTLPVSESAKAKLAPRTIIDHIELIGQMFRWACHPERRYAAYDPTEGVRLPKIDEAETEPYEDDHVDLILRLLEPGTVRRAGFFAFGLGARLAEMLGCQESGWNEKEDELELAHALKRAQGRQVLAARGKNASAKRTLPVGAEMAQLIRDQIADNRSRGFAPGQLFPTPSGTPWNPSNFRNRHWYPAVYAAYVKVMDSNLRERWLACVDDDWGDAARLLLIDDVSVRTVLHLKWDQMDGGQIRYQDGDGEDATGSLPDDLARRLELARAEATGRRVFPGKRGNPISRKTFIEKVFVEPFERAGIDLDRRIHRTRHTYVSMLGVTEPDLSDRELQARIGHSSPASTARYKHLFERQKAKPADVLPAIGGGRPKTSQDDALRMAAAALGMRPEELAARLADAA